MMSGFEHFTLGAFHGYLFGVVLAIVLATGWGVDELWPLPLLAVPFGVYKTVKHTRLAWRERKEKKVK